ncbi:MAG: class IV adenylate cyclase [Promethearchaeota archaeon]|nr:MAG: class IV adenylate cyclase [Candidatus Lokiarchaeota archaeon]
MCKLIEVEIKVKLSDPEKFRQEFEKQGGNYKLSLFHKDTYYNMPLGLRDFKNSDEALRIRKSIEYNKKNESRKEINFYLTYKGAKLDRTTKTRKEIETLIGDGEKIKEILETLGFRKVLTVEKDRELYEFDFHGKTIEVLLDFLPILNNHFIEVELKTETEEKIEQTREILFNFLKKFQILKDESIRKSYLELILEKMGEIK